MLKKLSEQLRAKFPATSHGYSMVKTARFLRIFLSWKQAQWKFNHCSKKKRQSEKGKAKKNAILVERKACCYINVANAFLSRLELVLAHVQPENLQNVRKNLCVFSKKL